MTDIVAAPIPEKGLLSRAVGVIVAPGATFRTVVASPRPAAILLLVALLTGLATALPQLTERGQQTAMAMQRQQTERFTGQPMTDAQVTQMERFARYTPYFVFAGTFIALPLFSLFFTAIYWAVFNTFLGATATFKQVLGIVTHSTVVSALGAMLSSPIMYLQDTPPRSFAGPFNLGALVPMLDAASLPSRFLSLVGVFTIWQIVVTGIGLAVLYKRKSSFGINSALLSIYLAVVAVIAIVFPSLTPR